MSTNKIFSKVDWFQAVFYDVSFDYVFNHFLELNISFTDQLLNDVFERSFGAYDTHTGIAFYGASASASSRDFLVASEEGNPFFAKFSRIILMLSGSCLDQLRIFYPDPFDLDRILRKIPDTDDVDQPRWRVSRVDFAFDFVNYKYDIYKECVSELTRLSYDRMIKTKSCCRPLHFSIRSGGEESIYIGKTRSNRLLRIYNKKLEQTKNGVLNSLPDDSINFEIDTWNRLELQCRNEWAEKYLFHVTDYLQVLREIYEYYAFTDREGHISELWKNLFDWQTIPQIIQNAYYSKVRVTKDSLYAQFLKSLSALAPFAMVYSEDFVIEHFRLWFANTFSPDNMSSKQVRSLLHRANCLTDFANDSSKYTGVQVLHEDGCTYLQLLHKYKLT